MKRLQETVHVMQAAVDGRRHILIGHPDPAITETADHLTRLGATPSLIIGSGPAPLDRDPALWLDLGLGHRPTIEGLRSYLRTLDEKSDVITDAVARFDPDGDAVALGSYFYRRTQLSGRPYLGHLTENAEQLNGAAAGHRFLLDAGIPVVAGHIAALRDEADLVAAMQAVDAGLGTCWSGQPVDTFTFDGELVRTVCSPAEAREARDSLRDLCDEVLISTREAGYRLTVDCLSHGSRAEVIDLSHKHTVTNRSTRSETVFMVGSLTNAQGAVVDAATSAARSVGNLLHERLAFQGLFTLEGIVTESGVEPVRWIGMSTRVSGGLVRLGSELDFPMSLFSTLHSSGQLKDLDTTAMSSTIREYRQTKPRLSAWLTSAAAPHTRGAWWLIDDENGWRELLPGERPHAVAELSTFTAQNGQPTGRLRIEFSRSAAMPPPQARRAAIRCTQYIDEIAGAGLADRYVLRSTTS